MINYKLADVMSGRDCGENRDVDSEVQICV